ncbi:uncharacterized protein LOC127720810 [Mytilus californianus]|uniref:uncharacterized protein LOC127720810 n=1 Tax=Mytilus californianus TaxID=6549 RepID=UPI0022455774|nr:uncharacterized protein LOC127720810 [Mytilus californianus]
MVVIYLLNTLCRILMVMTCFSNADRYNLTWKVAKKVWKYGEDLSLYCQVENCCLDSSGWIKWTSKNEFSTIFIDVKDLTVAGSSKYNGKINENGFFLVLRNITREDFNVYYSCTYGFHVSKKKILLETDAFFAKTQIDNGVSSEDKEFRISLPWVAFALCIFWLVPVVIIVVVCKKQKRDAINKESTHRKDASQLQHSYTDQPLGNSKPEILILRQTNAGEYIEQLQSPGGYSMWPNNGLRFADLKMLSEAGSETEEPPDFRPSLQELNLRKVIKLQD